MDIETDPDAPPGSADTDTANAIKIRVEDVPETAGDWPLKGEGNLNPGGGGGGQGTLPHWSAMMAKVKLYWETYDQPGDNTAIDVHPAVPANGGKRIFPGKKEYNDTAENAAKRRYVFAVVEFAEGADLPDKMYYRVWDVDDPSSDTAPIDENGPVGGDNFGKDEGEQRNGWHVADEDEDGKHISDVTMGHIMRFVDDEGTEGEEGDTCADHVVKCAVRVGMQPGDNWRFAVAWGDGAQARLEAMTQPQADTCHPPEGVTESEMLTTWRKLHLELDSMASGQDNPVSGKNIDAVAWNTPHTGETRCELNGFEPNDDGRYEGGTMTVTGGGIYPIIDHWDAWWDDYAVVSGNATGDLNKAASLVDDDVCPLPRKADWSLVNQKFAPAYIEAVEEPGVYNPDVPFNPTVMNGAEVVVPLATPKQNRNTSADYWVSLILSCHQGKIETGGGIKTSVDGDPDLYYHVHLDSWKEGDEFLFWGLTVPPKDPDWGQNISLVFLEACRESEAQYKQSQTELWPTIKIPRNITAKDEEQITVVHEVGWVFGWNQDGPPGTPMQYGAFPSMNFNEDQIKCFRESKEIEK
ncbi:MAG: hypothetical protein WBC39_06185 [Phycisphaerae bacterium]